MQVCQKSYFYHMNLKWGLNNCYLDTFWEGQLRFTEWDRNFGFQLHLSSGVKSSDQEAAQLTWITSLIQKTFKLQNSPNEAGCVALKKTKQDFTRFSFVIQVFIVLSVFEQFKHISWTLNSENLKFFFLLTHIDVFKGIYPSW